METIIVLIGYLPQVAAFYWNFSFSWCSQKAAIVMGNHSPAHNSHVSSGETGHLLWHQPAGPQEICACSTGLLRCSLTQAILFGCSLVLSLVCVLLKLPFPWLIIRMGSGRAHRAPVGRVPLPCREGYEKGQDHRFLQQHEGGNKKNQAYSHISTPNCC